MILLVILNFKLIFLITGKATSFIEFVLEAEAEYERSEAADKDEITLDSDGKAKVTKFMTTNEMVAQCVLFFLAG